jgi:putative transposase
MGSSSDCGAVASGRRCPGGTAPRAPSTTGSSGGSRAASSRRSGRCWSPSATNSAGWTGSGNRPTRCWARPGSGGKKTGKNPTDRGKKGTKKSLVTDGDGGPLGVVIAGANVVEQKWLKETIEAIVVERPDPDEVKQNLCLDKGYDNPRSREAAAEGGYAPHIREIGEEKKTCDGSKGHRPRRWVVERTFAWLSKCRGILVRYEKKDDNYLGLIQMACALLWFRRLHRMGRCDATQNTT